MPRPLVSNYDPKEKRKVWQSFADAFRGVGACIRSERNMRIHLVMCAYVLFFASRLSLSRGELAGLLLAIGSVMAAEMLNTAVEKLCDFTQKNRNRYIRFVKDVAAGGVLLAAMGALLVGVVILFRPELWNLLRVILRNPVYLAVGVGSLVLAVWFVFWGPVWLEERLDRFRHGNK